MWESVEAYLLSWRSSSDENLIRDGMTLAPSALAAFDRAEAGARARQHTCPGTEQLLLGILAEVSGEARVLSEFFRVDRSALMRMITEEIG